MSTAAPATFDEVWAKEFAPVIAARVELEAQARAEAFVDLPRVVCGEPIWLMTPAHLLILDGFENPFVVAGGEPDVFDRAQFIWELHATNDHTDRLANLWRRERMIRRLSRRALEPDCEEIASYTARIFQDLSSVEHSALITGDSALKAPPKIYFLSSLLVGAAADVGPIDPMSMKPLSQTPLPRLYQYAKASARMKGDADATGKGELDRMHSECLRRVNDINRAAGLIN